MGIEFKTKQEMDEHVCDEFGARLSFSQSETPNSPCVRQVGAVKRDEC